MKAEEGFLSDPFERIRSSRFCFRTVVNYQPNNSSYLFIRLCASVSLWFTRFLCTVSVPSVSPW